jgi:type I restriction-modification system DNA methylase subunit
LQPSPADQVKPGTLGQVQRPAAREVGLHQRAVRHFPGGLVRVDRRLRLIEAVRGMAQEDMMRTFDSEGLRTASGDVFGRIYEYFLAEFSKQGAHDNGEFFTPPSIVQTIVNVIEPDHGIILDPACGSGGMFVQSSHFIEDAGQDTMKRVTFYGHEKNETTARLAQINLAVHGLQGTIRAGNEAITYYKDPFSISFCRTVASSRPALDAWEDMTTPARPVWFK